MEVIIIRVIKKINITKNISLALTATSRGTFFINDGKAFSIDQVSRICKMAIQRGLTTKEELKKQFDEINLTEVDDPQSLL